MHTATTQKMPLVQNGILMRDGHTGKNGRSASATFNIDDWNIEKGEFKDISGTNANDFVPNSYPLFKFSGPSEYLGVNNDTLTIVRTPLNLDDKNYRVIVSTPAFKCDTAVASNCSDKR